MRNPNIHHRLALFIAVLAALVSVENGHARTAKHTERADRDKSQIIKSILLQQDLLNRGLRVGEVRGIIYLSTINIAPDLVPKIRDISFVLLNPDESNWPKSGFTLFEFSKFELNGSKVTVSLTDTWLNRSNRHSYHKISTVRLDVQ